jgi:hypothetical protein
MILFTDLAYILEVYLNGITIIYSLAVLYLLLHESYFWNVHSLSHQSVGPDIRVRTEEMMRVKN